MVERRRQLTRELEDVQKGATCPSCGLKRVPKKTGQEGEERPRQCTSFESAEATPYTSDRPAERRVTEGLQRANVWLRKRFTEI